MLIVLIEGNLIARDLAMKAIRGRFAGSELVVLKAAGELLLGAERFKKADVIVTDCRLPLVEPPTSELDDEEEALRRLAKRFPALVRAWDDVQGGCLLVGWMRSQGWKMPVILHTAALPEEWTEVARTDKRVFFSLKHFRTEHLATDIQTVVA